MLIGCVALLFDPIVGIASLLVSVLLLATCYYLYRSWKREEDEEEASIMLRFSSRFDSLQKAIETRLREL
jgi:hypothetical protein